MLKLIIFSAPSGAGKTTIVKELLQKSELKLRFSVSAGSRAPRAGEVDGRDYYFFSANEFKEKIANGEFLEWQEVYPNHFYGTLLSELTRIERDGYNIVFDVDVVGGVNIKKQFGNSALALFIMPPSLEELENRLKLRATDSPENIAKRVAKAREEIEFAPHFDKIIVNDRLPEAIEEAFNAVKHFLE